MAKKKNEPEETVEPADYPGDQNDAPQEGVEPAVDPGDQNDAPQVEGKDDPGPDAAAEGAQRPEDSGPPTTVGVATGVLLKAARRAGFLDVQIAKYTDAATLKTVVLKLKPALAYMFMKKPAGGPPRPAPVKKRQVFAFETSVKAGGRNHARIAEAEQQQIDAKIKNRGIALHDMVCVDITRSLKPEGGRFISAVTVRYMAVED